MRWVVSVEASLLGALVFINEAAEVLLGEAEAEVEQGEKVLLAASMSLSPCFKREEEYHSRKKRP